MDFLANSHPGELSETSLETATSHKVGRRIADIGRQSAVALTGAIALVLVSPAIEATIFPPAGTAYIAPPPGYNLNVRSGPGTHYPAVNTLRRGTPINITGFYEHGWAQLADRTWVAGNLINSQPPAGTGGGQQQTVPSIAYIASSSNVNIRSGPGTRYPVVNTLAPGTAIRITGFFEHGWAQLEDLTWVAGNLIRIGQPIGPTPPQDDVLRVGSRSPRVVEVEIRLRELGYVTNDFVPDEYFGTDTELAVRNFQFRNGLTQNGIVDQVTSNQLFSVKAIPNPDAIPDPIPCIPLRVGSVCPEVLETELRLQNLGYLPNSFIPDQIYDRNTAEAVRNFQTMNGLSPTGEVDEQTRDRLRDPNAAPAPGGPGDPGGSPYQTLRRGSNGPDVLRLEERLQDLGYFTLRAADDDYDIFTVRAVENFQRRNNLSPINGVADPRTQEVLYGDNAIPNSDDFPPPILEPGDPEDPGDPGQLPGGQQATVRTNDGTEAIAFTGPGIEYDLAGFVPNGTTVTLTGRTENNWYEMQNGNWLEGSFLVFN